MSCLTSLLVIFLGFLSRSAWAETMSEGLPRASFGLGLSTMHVEQPDGNIEQRYRLDLQNYDRLRFGFRLHNRIGYAPDSRPRSDALQVHHHFYEFYSGLQWTSTKLFRFALGVGPHLILEQTNIRVHFNQESDRTYNRWQLGWLTEAQVDYAFNDHWELALNLAWQFRTAVEKQDLCFGVSLLFNTGIARKDDSGKTPPASLPPTPPR